MNSAVKEYDSASTSAQWERVGAGQFDALGGRVFHYAKDGGSAVARGKLAVSATVAHTNLNFQTAPTGGSTTEAKITLGATALTVDQYKDGWFVVQDGTGEGRAYPIEGHAAYSASTTATINLKEAIDTTGALSEANVDLIYNLYDEIQLSVADQADVPVGVPIVALTAGYFGWVQTWGAAAVLQDEAVAIGDMLTTGSSIVGAVEADDAAGEPLIGMQGPQTGVDTEYTLVYLKLDPLVGNSG